jgi:hypothetical protein
MHAGVSLTCISILVHSFVHSGCRLLLWNILSEQIRASCSVCNINLRSIISIATGIYKFMCFLISYAFVWLSWSSGSDQLAIFFSDSIYECGCPFRWPWGAGTGGAALEWYETQKLGGSTMIKDLIPQCEDEEFKSPHLETRLHLH